MILVNVKLLLAFVNYMLAGGLSPAAPDCTRAAGSGSPSVYCLPLLPTDATPTASGTAVLRPPPGPFSLAVTRDGRLLFMVELTLQGLPDPSALGGFRGYVAWATTPELQPFIRLGPVRNGRTTLGPFDLERFIIMVSAEPRLDARERTGPLVLRGSSPSLMMVPHGVTGLPPQAVSPHQHHGPGGWTMPPMHPRASPMPAGLERLRPDLAPFLPGGDPASLPPVSRSRIYRLADGDTIVLRAIRVRSSLRGQTLIQYAYDGQIPGPRLELAAGGTIFVRFVNQTDLPSSIHWHGLRLDNGSDGVPGLTQPPVPPGGEFLYRVHAPDPGLFWYHPHSRGDVSQDLGLAGNIIVRPEVERRRGGEAEVRESFLMLDDLLLAEDKPVPYGREAATHALMGRFGNVLLVNGSERWQMEARAGERVRLYLTNTASARTFNFSIDKAALRVVGADAGRYSQPRTVASVVIAPSERYLVEPQLSRGGRHLLVNRVRGIDRVTGRFFSQVDTLGALTVRGSAAARPNGDAGADDSLVRLVGRWRNRPPDRTLVLTLRTSSLPFGLVQALRLDTAYVHPLEWTSSMPMVDWLSTGRQVSWVIRDSLSGAEGMAIDWRVRRETPLVVRLVNDRHVLHPMAHPIHLHGQRFLVLSTNGVANRDPVWKDTALVPAGGTVDLLVDTSNPGRWMLHCHIAEHLEAGMHTVLTID